MKRYIRVPSSMSYNQYVFGDWDKDKIKNIDDPFPFDPNRSQWAEHSMHSEYGSRDVKLSDQLRAIKKFNESNVPFTKRFLKKHPGSYGRVKSVASTVMKLRRAYLPLMGDVTATTIPTENRALAMKERVRVKKQYRTDPKLTDDFYAKPAGGHYYAYHETIIGPKKRLMEVQVKSKKMAALQKEMHSFYKKGDMPPRQKRYFVKEARRLYKEGY